MNKKHKIIGIITLLASIIISIFAMVPISNIKESSIWMSKVDDNKKIVELSIPGTHDSGATHSIFDVAGKCQDLSIKQQLKIGVRFFDIRLQQVNDSLNVVHSFVDQNLSFEKVLKDMDGFIKENNSEFLIVSIKEDADSKNSNKSFDKLVLEYLNRYDKTICLDNNLPETIKEARGKIYILSRFSSEIGIQAYMGWQDSTTFTIDNLYVQDNYCIDDINIKKEDILNTLNYSKTNQDKLVLNFTSCYLDYGFPPTYAAPPAIDINPWLIKTINENDDSVGIIVADFISKEMALAIYKRNIL